MELKRKKCAIIGSNGFIGRHLYTYLLKKGILLDPYDIGDSDLPNYKKIDLTSKDSLSIINMDVDYIFLFSGLTGTYAGFDNYESYNAVNEIGLINLLDQIRKSIYRPKIVFPSTRLIYKGHDKPLKEDDTKETKTIYAVNKLACEGLLKAYHYSFDIPYTIFRICVPYGNLISADYSFGTVGNFIKQAEVKKIITLFGDGEIKRTFTHMEDLCYQIIKAAFLKESDGEVYNVGGETLSLREVATLIADKFKCGVVSIPWPDRDFRLESFHTYFDDEKIKKIISISNYKKMSEFINDI